MKIYKEIEIDSCDLSNDKLIEILDDRICYANILLNEEAQKKLAPISEEMSQKLLEIKRYIDHPSSFLPK